VKERIKLFVMGVVAGSLALTISFLLRIFAGGLFIPELAAQTLFSITPGVIESQSVGTLGSLAKYSAFAGATAVNLVLYGVLGVLLYGMYRRLVTKGYVVNVLQLSFFSYIVLFVLGMVLSEATEVQTQPLTIQLISLYLLPPHIAFGFSLYYMFQRLVARLELIDQENFITEHRTDLGRRRLLRAAVAGAIVSAALFYGVGVLFSKPSKPSEGRYSEPAISLSGSGSIFAEPALAPFVAAEVTPNGRFYKVDTNLITPVVDVNSWKLKVKGLVNDSLELTYEELKSLPSVEEYATLECISNKISDDLISTALWKGVSLKSLLEKAQLRPEATYVVFRCYDGYDVGIPIERGLLRETILAYEMNGVTLPADHGFPLRAIVPGLYGMMNAKWITEIELVNKVYEGFWQRKGWSNNAEYETHSTIILPGEALRSRFGDLSSRIVLGSKVPIAGIAFAGDRGISKVEVSMDGGKTWETARIKDPLSDNTWVLWAIDWNPQVEGRYSIIVRATDKAGKVQEEKLQNPFPSGATGYHRVGITVEAPS
jgi:DMSO/TMAO reductase YedYZ molybdopterin-dependent catalytic subunit